MAEQKLLAKKEIPASVETSDKAMAERKFSVDKEVPVSPETPNKAAAEQKLLVTEKAQKAPVRTQFRRSPIILGPWILYILLITVTASSDSALLVYGQVKCNTLLSWYVWMTDLTRFMVAWTWRHWSPYQQILQRWTQEALLPWILRVWDSVRHKIRDELSSWIPRLRHYNKHTLSPCIRDILLPPIFSAGQSSKDTLLSWIQDVLLPAAYSTWNTTLDKLGPAIEVIQSGSSSLAPSPESIPASLRGAMFELMNFVWPLRWATIRDAILAVVGVITMVWLLSKLRRQRPRARVITSAVVNEGHQTSFEKPEEGGSGA